MALPPGLLLRCWEAAGVAEIPEDGKVVVVVVNVDPVSPLGVPPTCTIVVALGGELAPLRSLHLSLRDGLVLLWSEVVSRYVCLFTEEDLAPGPPGHVDKGCEVEGISTKGVLRDNEKDK